MTDTAPASGRRRLFLALGIAIIIAAGVGIWMEFFQTYHFAVVQPAVLYRDGNRGMREFETTVRRINPKTVIALIDDTEFNDPAKPQFRQESIDLKQRGIRYERIAIPLGGWPSDAELKEFFDIVQNPANQPVLLHCAQGVRRTGMFAAAYQESVMKMSDTQVKQQIERFGRKDGSPTLADLDRFIASYDGPSRHFSPPAVSAGQAGGAE